MNEVLKRMKIVWENLGIQEYFLRVHHFSSDKFASKPSSLNSFYNWCSTREIMDENSQTIRRAFKTAELFAGSKDIELAINFAWKEYPIITR